MKKRYLGLISLLAAAQLCGCTAVPDRAPDSTSAPAAEETEEVAIYEETLTKRYPVNKADAVYTLNAEGGVYEGEMRTDGDYYEGQGYVILDEGMTLTHIAEPEYAQHYRIVIAAQSYTGAVIQLGTARETAGYYYIPATKSPEFALYAIDCVYLPNAPTVLTFTVTEGSASLDYIIAENTDEVSADSYRTGTAAMSPNSTLSAIGAMKYLSESYGKHVITAQNVTPGTNAEIELLFNETGRYPAMRCGELAPLTDKLDEERAEADLALAYEWGQKGGLVSYTWHWYSPDTVRSVYTEQTGFNLHAAIDGADIPEIAAADTDQLRALLETGALTAELRDLITDMDAAAAELKRFADADIPVIWQPLPEGETDLYWWGGNADSYKALWELMFLRFTEYHGLGNLIWVWNGSSPEFRPSDKQCDIIGQTLSEGSSASFAGRFGALASMEGFAVKPMAITACDRLPKPEYLLRDNALWLWTAIDSGDVIINPDGTLSERLTDWQTLHDAYNSELCITLDELPVFTEYAVTD